jgi:hypothetical protein
MSTTRVSQGLFILATVRKAPLTVESVKAKVKKPDNFSSGKVQPIKYY